MRFSAAIHPQQPLPASAAELIRRLISAKAAPHRPDTPSQADEVPADLDQRVRMVGEW